MDQTFVLLNNQLSFSTEAILSPICTFCQLARVLNKDTVWLDEASPANTCIPFNLGWRGPIHLRSVPTPLSSESNKVLQV
jgi:hypothetical protein